MSKCQHCKGPCKNSFCCAGCETAYFIIGKFNLGQYYNYCSQLYNRTPPKVTNVENSLNYEEYIIQTNDHFEIALLVEGIHCGSCIWLIESTLLQNGASEARINMSTKRLILKWQGTKEDLDKHIQIVEKIGYKLIPFTADNKLNAGREFEKSLLKYLFVAGFASIAMMMTLWGVWVGTMDGSIGEYMKFSIQLISTVIAVPSIIYSSRPFIVSAFKALRAGKTNMDVPISLAIILTTIISIFETAINSDQVYFEAAIGLIFFLLIGRYLDLKFRNQALETASNLMLSQISSVTVLRDDKFYLIPIKQALPTDIIFVAVGEKIPVDGVIIDGETQIDNSLITGESLPVKAAVGSQVYSGTLNMEAPIKIKIINMGSNTILSEIIRLIENAEQSKSKYVTVADKIAKKYTLAVSIISTCTFAGWLLLGANIETALLYAISVLIITCPCALGLAVPVVQIIATSKLLKNGVLVKTKDALEKIAEVDSIVFDKTGTLTTGEFKLVSRASKADLKLAASICAQSKHPLSKALAKEYTGKLLSLKVEEHRGNGLSTYYQGHLVRLGNAEFCGIEVVEASESPEVYMVSDNKTARFTFRDNIKEDAQEVLGKLKLPITILSGDNENVVRSIAKFLKVENYYFKKKPKDKFDFLISLEKKGHKVLMVGDGLNDSAALKAAHASISPSSALEISQVASDFVIQGNKLIPILLILDTAKRSIRLVKQNFALSIGYNIIFIPIAIFGHATPILASIAMSSSSLLVILNSLRLKR